MQVSPVGLRRARTGMVALATVLMVATACSDDAPFTYVALGDSYTAAPLVPETDYVGGCLRSEHNYPHLVAEGLPGTQLTDVSCSGAQTSAMLAGQQIGAAVQPAQFDALTSDTDLVTVGIGGNDGGLFATLLGTCIELADSDPTGSPCRDAMQVAGVDRLEVALASIRTQVTATITGILERSPDARILVVGYPQIYPETGTCPELLPLATGDYVYSREINEHLTDAVQAAAADTGAEYIDIWAASAGHDICADDAWINGQRTDEDALRYHPFAAEQRAVADLILDLL